MFSRFILAHLLASCVFFLLSRVPTAASKFSKATWTISWTSKQSQNKQHKANLMYLHTEDLWILDTFYQDGPFFNQMIHFQPEILWFPNIFQPEDLWTPNALCGVLSQRNSFREGLCLTAVVYPALNYFIVGELCFCQAVVFGRKGWTFCFS